jgi:hypothetical protein
MASGFPGSIDNFTDPLSNSPLTSPDHATLHADVNDAVEKIETYMGLVKVIPTGATGGTVGSTGTVTVGNAVSSVTINNAFSANYDNYKILCTGGVGSTAQSIRMVLGASNTGYFSLLMYAAYATGTYTSLTDNNQVRFSFVGETTTSNAIVNLDVQAPFLAKFTTIGGFYSGSVAGAISGYHGVSASYSNFTLSVAGTMTGGTIRVYGYRN